MTASPLDSIWEGWKPPTELNRSFPRRVELTGRGVGLLCLSLAFALGGIAGAIALRIQAQHRAAEIRLMEAQGVETQGLVTRLWRTGGKTDEPMVQYRFSTGPNQYQGRSVVTSRHWAGLTVGLPITVRYLPSNPLVNYPSTDPLRPASIWLSIFVAGVFLLLAGVFTLSVRGSRRLLEEGRAAPGIVTRNRRIRSNEGSHNQIIYEFILREGSKHKGRANRAPIPEGTVICVVYNPDNPRRSAPYPFGLTKVADL
jgi:hypothetical protein